MIHTLTITDFRNHKSSRISVMGAGNVVITGPNGAGKTAIIEAVSMLGGDKGLRNAPMVDVARFNGSGGFSVCALLDDDTKLSVCFQNGENNRKAQIDGNSANLVELGKYIRIVWLTPREDRLFVDTANERRAFFDRMVASFYPMHAGRVARLNKLLAERAFALKNSHDNLWLDALDEQISGTAVAVADARIKYAGELNFFLKNFAVSITGTLEENIVKSNAAEAERVYLEYLHNNRTLVADKMILDGPHKSDFGAINKILNLPVNLTSTGQQKNCLVDLVLAHAKLLHAKTSVKPLILLDEAVAHLDENTREKMFKELGDADAQVWATGLDPSVFKNIPNVVFVSCNNGSISNILASENIKNGEN